MRHTPPRPSYADLAELVRLPAVLSVPGDVVTGAAMTSSARLPSRTVALAGASSLIYLGGMALNDLADHEVDAVERPHRPIPSGRVSRRQAAQLGHGLLLSGVALAGLADRRSLRIAVPLGGAVYAYDLALKDTPAGPATMALCRTLDVLLGGTVGRVREALPAAATIGAHTFVVTSISRQETEGTTPTRAAVAVGAGAAVVASSAAAIARWGRAGHRRSAVGPLAAHAVLQAREGLRAIADPTPASLQRLVGAGVLGMLPQQSALTLSRGHRFLGAALAGAWPVARRLARRRAVT